MANSLGSLSQWITVVYNCLSAPLCISFLPLPLSSLLCSRSLPPCPSHWHSSLRDKWRGDTRILEGTALPARSPHPSPPSRAPRGTMEIWSPGAHVPVSACASSQGERGGGGSGKGNMAWHGGSGHPALKSSFPLPHSHFPCQVQLFRAAGRSMAPRSHPSPGGFRRKSAGV